MGLTGIIGTGQSLSAGARAPAVLSTNQPYNNLKLSTGDCPGPSIPATPISRWCRLINDWQTGAELPEFLGRKISGETPHSAMANELTAPSA